MAKPNYKFEKRKKELEKQKKKDEKLRRKQARKDDSPESEADDGAERGEG